MRKQPYATFPGRSKADVEYCLKCVWHSILVDYVCCDYTTQPGHHMRGCRAGVGCDKFEPIKTARPERSKPRIKRPEEPKPEPMSMKERAKLGGAAAAAAKAAKMVPWKPGDKTMLLAMVGWEKVAEIAGMGESNLYYSRRHGRIRRDAAEKIYAALGVDVTGGELEGKCEKLN